LTGSPYINRFLQPDTIIPDPANPQSWNRFSYVLNNPIRFNDPTGHKACETIEECNEMGITPSGKDLTYNQIMTKSKLPKLKDVKDMNLSEDGEDFLFSWEGGWSDIPFDDAPDGAGDCTIGYGHKLHDGKCDERDQYYRDNPISNATARLWAQGAIDKAEEIIEDTIKLKLTQSQFDVLISYIYNSGGLPGHWYRDKEIPELLNSGKYYEAAMVIDSGPYYQGNTYRPGLEDRRHDEAAIFLFGP
jgi:GH24 family phage-related lysozyme (muramidase)